VSHHRVYNLEDKQPVIHRNAKILEGKWPVIIHRAVTDPGTGTVIFKVAQRHFNIFQEKKEPEVIRLF